MVGWAGGGVQLKLRISSSLSWSGGQAARTARDLLGPNFLSHSRLAKSQKFSRLTSQCQLSLWNMSIEHLLFRTILGHERTMFFDIFSCRPGRGLKYVRHNLASFNGHMFIYHDHVRILCGPYQNHIMDISNFGRSRALYFSTLDLLSLWYMSN